MVFMQSVRPGKHLAKETGHQSTAGKAALGRLLSPLGQGIQDKVDLRALRRIDMFLQMTLELRLSVMCRTQLWASKAWGMQGWAYLRPAPPSRFVPSAEDARVQKTTR